MKPVQETSTIWPSTRPSLGEMDTPGPVAGAADMAEADEASTAPATASTRVRRTARAITASRSLLRRRFVDLARPICPCARTATAAARSARVECRERQRQGRMPVRLPRRASPRRAGGRRAAPPSAARRPTGATPAVVGPVLAVGAGRGRLGAAAGPRVLPVGPFDDRGCRAAGAAGGVAALWVAGRPGGAAAGDRRVVALGERRRRRRSGDAADGGEDAPAPAPASAARTQRGSLALAGAGRVEDVAARARCPSRR